MQVSSAGCGSRFGEAIKLERFASDTRPVDSAIPHTVMFANAQYTTRVEIHWRVRQNTTFVITVDQNFDVLVLLTTNTCDAGMWAFERSSNALLTFNCKSNTALQTIFQQLPPKLQCTVGKIKSLSSLDLIAKFADHNVCTSTLERLTTAEFAFLDFSKFDTADTLQQLLHATQSAILKQDIPILKCCFMHDPLVCRCRIADSLWRW